MQTRTKFFLGMIELWPFLLMCVGLGLAWEIGWDLIPWSAIIFRDVIDGVLYVVQEVAKGINSGTSFVSGLWHDVGGHGSIPSFTVPTATTVMGDMGSWFDTWLNLGETCAYIDGWWPVVLGILQIKYAQQACDLRRFYYGVWGVSGSLELSLGWLGGDAAPFPGANCYFADGTSGANWCPYAKFFYVPLDLLPVALVIILLLKSFWGCIQIALLWTWDVFLGILDVLWTLCQVGALIYRRVAATGKELEAT